ncbi:MAG: hypothetical protein PHP12_05320 [Bacilli bacterium]|nr:hypothetical protein [Bacilli bacterium]
MKLSYWLEKLEKAFEPVREFIIENHSIVKVVFWIFLIVFVFGGILKNTIERGK